MSVPACPSDRRESGHWMDVRRSRQTGEIPVPGAFSWSLFFFFPFSLFFHHPSIPLFFFPSPPLYRLQVSSSLPVITWTSERTKRISLIFYFYLFFFSWRSCPLSPSHPLSAWSSPCLCVTLRSQTPLEARAQKPTKLKRKTRDLSCCWKYKKKMYLSRRTLTMCTERLKETEREEERDCSYISAFVFFPFLVLF